MWERKQVPPELARVLARQEGVVRSAVVTELMGRAALRRLVDAGAWTRVTPGVVAAASTTTERHRLWAGCLLGGPGSALGGWSALRAAGLRVEGASGRAPVEVWLPPGVRRADRPGWSFREDGLARLAHVVGTLPRIRLEEALLDVAPGLALEEWVDLAAEVTREGAVNVVRLLAAARGRPRLAGRSMVETVLADLVGVESTLEWAYRDDVERAHGLPAGRRQTSLSQGTRSDVHYDGFGVVAEIDGRCHAATQFRDAERDNRHGEQGLITLRYGSVAIRVHPCRTAEQVARTLRARGWTGEALRCPQCSCAA